MKKKTKIVLIILIVFNFYLLWLNIKLKSDISDSKNVYEAVLNNMNKLRMLDHLKVNNRTLTNDRLNLIVIWGPNGCGACKQKMAGEFDEYRKLFSGMFKFVYVGNHERQIRNFHVEKYLTMHINNSSELFEPNYEIGQPIVLLTNNKGDVLIAHEIILDDTLEFNNFNKKASLILSASQ